MQGSNQPAQIRLGVCALLVLHPTSGANSRIQWGCAGRQPLSGAKLRPCVCGSAVRGGYSAGIWCCQLAVLALQLGMGSGCCDLLQQELGRTQPCSSATSCTAAASQQHSNIAVNAACNLHVAACSRFCRRSAAAAAQVQAAGVKLQPAVALLLSS